MQPAAPFPLAARTATVADTVVRLRDGIAIGDGRVAVIAGPCAVESEAQVLHAARAVREAGATLFRAGVWKPRTSPYAFQGLGEPALELLRRVRQETGLLVVTEAMDERGLDRAAEVADLIQIGSRNMQNYSLLRAAGRLGHPVLLKRGPAATVAELLSAAEYLLAEGNRDVVLCERGVRGFGSATRNILDLSVIPVVKRLSHLPILVDPSHGTGHRDYVPAMARAAVAAGADGVMIEVHPDPDRALSDGAQSLTPERFTELMIELRVLAESVRRPLLAPHPALA